MANSEKDKTEILNNEKIKLCAFIVNGEVYAVPILAVQEIIRPQIVTPIPLAEKHLRGLVNLRGHIVTSISLRTLFGFEDDLEAVHMNVIMKREDSLFSLVVDEICDVIEVEQELFCPTPDTLGRDVKKYLSGVYKLDDKLLMLIDLKKIFTNKKTDTDTE